MNGKDGGRVFPFLRDEKIGHQLWYKVFPKCQTLKRLIS